ncbi:soluble guanylate cyclase 89Da-like isoform X3 [Mizuhopecten yessoensis]|uniref:soluble guanylate cyclase 89Da-like isoform X3 n=1 Tax=Mizuhopecten yessoensis TaxID=6573 RepID=UPI000B45E644|nr:soluble guanylate cyclase 89Da-like isoform X3 [Mizuhopecten yessoensis]
MEDQNHLTVPLADHHVSDKGRRGKMYGMLLESVQYYIKTDHGEDIWRAVLEHVGLKNAVFTTHVVYPDHVMLDLSKACSVLVGDRTPEEYLQYFGQCFVKFFSHYGYDKIVRISGRHYRDFLKEIDNLHENMRFSFPHMHSPSFNIFPFCIVFDDSLIIRHTGASLPMLLETDSLVGSELLTRLLIRRPLIDCTWSNVKRLQRVTFEFQYRSPVHRLSNASGGSGVKPQASKVLLRGQVKFMEDWNMMVFLCAPLVSGLTDLEKMGLYISDLNMYDNSRQMVMTGWQHSSVLEYSIEQQVKQSDKISGTMQKLDEWQQKSNMLLYNMIPESIAQDLKAGVDPIKTCQVFEDVTILFSYLVDFTLICTRGTPMQIVQCVNNIFTVFDSVVDKHSCFKVETLGDAVYMVAGGVPDRHPNHAHQVAGLALDLLRLSKELKDPTTGKCLQFRLGMHSGGVVGGVIGRRMPQYCLFGDTVNTASRMQSHGKPGKIHVSEQSYGHLEKSNFKLVSRGTIAVKGKGTMQTYWLMEGGDSVDTSNIN